MNQLLNTAAFTALTGLLSRVDQDLGVVATHVEDTKVLLSDQKRKNAIMSSGGLPEEEKGSRIKPTDGKTILEGFARIDPPKFVPEKPSGDSQRPDYTKNAQEVRPDFIFPSRSTDIPERQNTPSYEKQRTDYAANSHAAYKYSPEIYAEHTHVAQPNMFDKVRESNSDQQKVLERLMQSPEFRAQYDNQGNTHNNPVRSDNEKLIQDTKLRMQQIFESHELKKKKKNY
jgi:hypothetical protein